MTYIIYDADVAAYTTIGDYEQRHACHIEIADVAEENDSADDGEEGDDSHDD